MSINLLCMSCKSSMKTGTAKCSKCGNNLTGKNKLYRVRVKLSSGQGWKSKTVPTMTLAIKFELQYKTQSIEQDTKIQLDAPNINKVWTEYLKWAKINKRSWDTDRYLWDHHIQSHFNDARMDRVAPYHIQDIMNHMNSKKKENGTSYAPATIKHIVVLIKHLFNWSIKQGYYQGTNPCNTIEMPRFDNKVTNPLSKEGIKSLMAVLDSWKNERAVLVIKFALYSGKRKGEVLSLTWDNVDFENRLLKLNAMNTKNKKGQTVPMNQHCMSILERCRDLKISSLVFPCSTGKLYIGFDCTWKRIREKAGVSIRFHDLSYPNLNKIQTFFKNA